MRGASSCTSFPLPTTLFNSTPPSFFIIPLGIIFFHPSLVLPCKHQLHPVTPIPLLPICTPLPFSDSILVLITHTHPVCEIGWWGWGGDGQSALVSSVGAVTERSQHRRIKRTHWRAHFCTASSYKGPTFPSVTHTHVRTQAHVNLYMCVY